MITTDEFGVEFFEFTRGGRKHHNVVASSVNYQKAADAVGQQVGVKIDGVVHNGWFCQHYDLVVYQIDEMFVGYNTNLFEFDGAFFTIKPRVKGGYWDHLTKEQLNGLKSPYDPIPK